jgi:hypothetical protein
MIDSFKALLAIARWKCLPRFSIAAYSQYGVTGADALIVG